jgi:hypothetical protein
MNNFHPKPHSAELTPKPNAKPMMKSNEFVKNYIQSSKVPFKGFTRKQKAETVTVSSP